ncbi:hypothetical protein D6D05_09038 [Aureobasidium pullulans]|nr:hypothetical protein D6D05_09038 [Aureobasidium pullulans]
MADADEDVIPRGPDVGDLDLSDETQDFRFLLNFSSDDAKIPKRGEKDFEPHHTDLQSKTLADSRDAMHTALSFQRVHQPKKYVLAHYHPETNMAYTEDPKGPLFKSMGKVFPAKEDPLGPRIAGENRIWLLPEEVIYLLERGTIDVRWPVDEDDEDDEGLPMSLQGAYAAFLGMEGDGEGALTFEKYSVYSGLKRSGYTVHRAPSWDGPGSDPGDDCYPPVQGTAWSLGLLRDKWQSMFIPRSATETEQKAGPLVKPGLYRNYAEIYRRLAIIPSYDPTSRTKDSANATDPAFRITYHLWKPGSTTYKKSDPGTPDFRIAVINARETSVPTLAQLSALIDTQSYEPPRKDVQLYQKLRSGYKSVILAVVDQGVTSYLRLADAGFCREKLFDRKPPAARKGGKVHLPRVCQQALEECLNCGALGHTWNFCHLGAHRLQPDYKYFALCHNCQKWHLPLPCQEPLVKCGGCEQLGHRREYCALDPSPSELFTTSMSAFISHSLTSGNSQWIMHNAALANEIYNIKMGAVMDTLQLAANRANGEEVRRYLSNAYRGTLHPSGTHGLTSARLSASSQPPAPATANTESQSLPLPRPSIPPQYHDPDHTLAPIQLHNVNTPQPSSSESSAQSVEPAPVTRASGIQTNHAYDGIFSFRTYEENAADERQVGIQNDSSGDGSITPRSSPCDARANSMEPEHEFYEGVMY